MSINTIPDKIPKKFLMRLKRGKYDDTILFALAVFRPHTMSIEQMNFYKFQYSRLSIDIRIIHVMVFLRE